MTVGKGVKIQVKNIQGQVIPVNLESDKNVGDVKKEIAKKMNEMADKNKDQNLQKVHPEQLRLTYKDDDLENDTTVGEISDVEDDFVFVFVGDASKVPINVRVHVFKGTGVDVTNLEVNLGDTADAVKDKLIANSFGPEDKSYTLFYKGRPLLDTRPIMEYGVENGSEILVGVIM